MAKVANKSSRHIVILLDGTGNQFGFENTNLIKTMSVLMLDDDQLVYYSSGVGTILPEGAGMWHKLKQTAAKVTDMGVAWSFDNFVCDAYRYLMDCYRDGDKVYILGFSRGSYTARALAGMIQKVGLLPRGNHNQIPLAWKVYTSPDDVKRASGLEMDSKESMSALYRRIFGISRTVSIHFVGVWDTVSSLGVISLPKLPFAGGVHGVQFFRQALALDERRARFLPEYRHLDAGEQPFEPYELAKTAALIREASEHVPDNGTASPLDKLLKSNPRQFAQTTNAAGDTVYARKNVECWFMGCHSDVGGGNDQNAVPSLSNIPFRWMLREAEACGLRLDPMGVALQPAIYTSPPIVKAGLIPPRLRTILDDQLYSKVLEVDSAEECKALVEKYLTPKILHDMLDMAAAYDTTRETPLSDDGLRLYKESLTFWWLPLEVFVLETKRYTNTGEEKRDWRSHLGQARQMIPGQYIHRSVQKRLRYHQSHKDDKYDGPKAKLPEDWKITWADLRDDKGPMIWED